MTIYQRIRLFKSREAKVLMAILIIVIVGLVSFVLAIVV